MVPNSMKTNNHLFVVSNIETVQGHLKSIYTNTLSTLCPLPWLEEAANAHFSFREVFIPLRTTDVRLLQRTVDRGNSDDPKVLSINKSYRQYRKRKRGRGVRQLQTIRHHPDPQSHRLVQVYILQVNERFMLNN